MCLRGTGCVARPRETEGLWGYNPCKVTLAIPHPVWGYNPVQDDRSDFTQWGEATPEFSKGWIVFSAPIFARLTLGNCCRAHRIDLWQPSPRLWSWGGRAGRSFLLGWTTVPSRLGTTRETSVDRGTSLIRKRPLPLGPPQNPRGIGLR